jgi:four helix bundle protein
MARARRGQLPAQSTVIQAISESRDRWGVMQLDHERLDVYDLSLEFLVLANGIIEGLPRGRSHLADQFTRASLSIVLNLAEGAGKHSKLDKRRYYVTARGWRQSLRRCWMSASDSSF